MLTVHAQTILQDRIYCTIDIYCPETVEPEANDLIFEIQVPVGAR